MIEQIRNIQPADRKAMTAAQERWNGVAKPLHSLGMLEDAVIRLAGITGTAEVRIDKRCVIDFCADNGVICEGVTQSDSSVTAVVARAMADGTSNINRMAQVFHTDVKPVDIGMVETVTHANLMACKISHGTRNIATEAAMTLEQAVQAIETGMDIVRQCQADGYQILVTGEMGIGNTTTSSALAAVLLHESPEAVTGRGAGLDEAGLRRKVEVIRRALALHTVTPEQPLELLAALGGYDIAGLVGLYLGGAVYRMPIVIDGFIAAVAAAVAVRIAPLAQEYMLCSHVSKEPAGRRILDLLGLQPLIQADLCLGEGTGGILLLPMLDAALAVYHSAHRFAELPIEQYEEFST